MKTCYGYVRVSTQKQGEGVSLEAQRDAILVFAAKSSITITQWFEEKETAAKSGRPVFNDMLRQLRRRTVSGVVLHKPDRAARNFGDWAKIGELSDSGIDVHFASESLDFRSRGGRLSADIQAVIAADYIRNLKEEIYKGQNGQLKQGIYPFSAPLGYQNNGGGKAKTIDPVKGPMVRQVFQLYASGEHSMRTILIEMKRMGLRNHRNTVVLKASLEAMFRNPFYTGVIRIDRSGAVYRGAHEALITTSLFEQVQTVRAGKCGKKVTKHNHTFHGLFMCQQCRLSMVPEYQKGHVYYRCHTSGCVTKTVREELIEEAVEKVLARLFLSNEDIETLTLSFERWIVEQTDTAPITTYDMQREQIDKRLERLTDALIDRLIETDTFNIRKQALVMEQVALDELKAKTLESRPSPQRTRKFLELVKSLLATYRIATKSEKREIVKIATSNRLVSGKNVLIEPSNWLQTAQDTLRVLLCADDRTTPRTSLDMLNHNMKSLVVSLRKYETALLEHNANNIND
jgi:site-specific DNA recombinase